MLFAGCLNNLALLISLAASTGPGNTPTSAPAAQTPVAARAQAGLRPGDQAPDFDIATTPYGWRKFSDLCRQSHVLLVFEPEVSTLAAIERNSARLAASSVVIAAVTSTTDGENWDLLEKMGLSYRLLSDPNGYVAEIFGVTDPAAGKPAPAWCLVDRDGRILQIERGIPVETLASDVEAAIGKAPMVADGVSSR